jgi:hypothetical protein
MKALQTGTYVLLATISAITFTQSKVTGKTKDGRV